MVKTDGSVYGIHHFYLNIAVPGFPEIIQGGIEYPDGQREEFVGIKPDFTYDPVNRRLKGGTHHLTLQSGEQRCLAIEPVSDTGFHLGTGLYFGLDGKHHGQWRGELHMDGEWFDDCTNIETAKRIHQIRDCLVKVTDGDAVGYAVQV